MTAYSDHVAYLREQWRKTGDNCFLDELKDASKRWADRPFTQLPPSPRIVERYKEGSLHVHFHFRAVPWDVRVEDVTIPQFLVFEPNPLLRNFRTESVIPPDQLSISSCKRSESERVVLVGVVESGQAVESIASAVRLQSLNECNLVQRDSLQFGDTILDEVRMRRADREVCLVVSCAPAVANDQLSDKMIECRSDVAQKIPSNDAQVIGGVGFNSESKDRSTIRLLLSSYNAFRFRHLLNDHLGVMEMLLCPTQLQVDAIERGVSHEPTE